MAQALGSKVASTATPYVRYTAADGHSICARLERQYTREGWVRNPVGSLMTVRIDLVRPEQAYDATAGAMFVFPGLLLLAGLLMTLLALGICLGAPADAARAAEAVSEDISNLLI